MTHVGVREMKDRLSEYLRRARAGEQVVITDRGRPVAALVGLRAEGADEAAWSLVSSGLCEWSGSKPRGLESRPRIPGRRAEEAVIEDRR